MRIVYDNIIFTLQRCGGISMVWQNLLSRIIDMCPNVSFLEYQNANDNICRQNLKISQDKISLKRMRCLKLMRFFNPSSNDISVEDRFIFHSSYYRICHSKNAVNVTTVHDFSYKLFVKNPIIRFVQCRQQFRAIRDSDAVVCISHNTRKDLLRILPDVNPSKVHVIYNGVDDRFSYRPGIQTEDYVLYVGKRDRYKNFDAIIEPLAKLHKNLKIVGIPLTKSEISRLALSGLDYEYCGVVSDEELNNLYNKAFCLLYTSLYEGFGLPVLEAQMAGCPVIAFNASSIPEVIGDKRLLIDEISVDALKEKMEYVSNNRERIVSEGFVNANRFSWDKMASEYYELYKRLV